LAIGLTVMSAAYAAGWISGWAFNPAVAAGAQLFDFLLGGASINGLWIYIIACFAGWALAGIRYKMINTMK
jgi:glycerol uptake facilitator-like aquaporin